MIFKMIIAYDGTNYGGWQNQHNSIGIQSLIEKALSTVLRKPTEVTGSGRTDAGVHAHAQVAHFSFDDGVHLPKLVISLNALLPKDIRIRHIEKADDDFHARFSAKSKTYHYHIHSFSDPFKRHYSYYVHHKINLPLLKEAAAHFVGTHDFTSFAHEASTGSASRNAIRTIHRLDVIEDHADLRLEFEGSGFLYKMVRNITGTLLDISSGKIPLSTLPDIFAAKDRTQAGKTAPAHGLFLAQVNYASTSFKDSK